MRTFESEPMQRPMLAFADAFDREEAVAEVRLGREARADSGAGLGEEVELAVVRMRGVDDRRARPEAAGLGQELDRPDAVLLDALLDLPWLLVGVDVEGEGMLLCVAPDLLEPVRRAGAHGVGGEPDVDAPLAEPLDLVQVLGSGGLAEAFESASRVGDVEEDEGDSGSVGRLGGCECLLEAEVVELTDRRVAGGEHLAVDLLVLGANSLRALLVGERQHRVAPGPEVAALGAAAERALEGMAVRVDEAGNREPLRHGSH